MRYLQWKREARKDHGRRVHRRREAFCFVAGQGEGDVAQPWLQSLLLGSSSPLAYPHLLMHALMKRMAHICGRTWYTRNEMALSMKRLRLVFTNPWVFSDGKQRKLPLRK